MILRLNVFISSTSDLSLERDAVKQALDKMEIDGSRFESWPSTPNDPIAECLERVEESDAVVLILGKKYGTLTENGISVTHLEYRHAIKFKIPVFVYLLDIPDRELDQIKFIEEVKLRHFNCSTIISTDDLKIQVRNSFIQEFTRCFRKVHSSPPESPPPPTGSLEQQSVAFLPGDAEEAYRILFNLYNSGDDLAIHLLAPQCEARFGDSPDIMNLVFMAEVNLGINGGTAIPERLEKAIEFWDSHGARTRCENSSLNYNQGNALSALKRFSEAIEKYKASLAKKPDYARCWKNLSAAYLAIDDISSTRKCLDEALRYDPQLFEALYCSATFSMKIDRNPETALFYLNQIITSRLSSIHLAAIHGWKAAVYMKLGRYAEGIACAEDAITNAPEAEWAWGVAGRLYALARNNGQQWLGHAANFWQRFIDKHPHNVEAWAELGYVYWFLREQKYKVDRSQRALFAFTKAMELGLEDGGLVWDRIGHLYQEEGNWKEAEKAYRQATQRNPEQFGYCLGVSLMSLNLYEEALPWVLAAAEKHQPDAISWFQVAICREKMGNIVEAETAYEKAIQLNPNYPEAWFNLGGLYWNQKVSQKAIATWKEAMDKFPGHELCKRVRDLLEIH